MVRSSIRRTPRKKGDELNSIKKLRRRNDYVWRRRSTLSTTKSSSGGRSARKAVNDTDAARTKLTVHYYHSTTSGVGHSRARNPSGRKQKKKKKGKKGKIGQETFKWRPGLYVLCGGRDRQNDVMKQFRSGTDKNKSMLYFLTASSL